MGVPRTYRKSQENFRINFNWEEIANGVGIVQLTSLGTTDSTGEQFGNIPASISEQADPQGSCNTLGGGSGDYNLVLERNFDNAKNSYATTIEGKAIVAITYGAVSSLNNTSNTHVICKIIKVDSAAAETVIGEIQSEEVIAAGSGAATTKTAIMTIDCSKTVINSSDFLRLNVEVWTKGVGTVPNNNGGYFAHDPSNSDATLGVANITAATNHTYLKWYVPFKVQI